jgi:RimJ/RimL family protein N-acetyltransferase
MKDNQNIAIFGKQVILVPYEEKFVERYHEWMKSPFLQEMTASEPLTLEGEYNMQQSWREDPKKCTFIVLSKQDSPNNECELPENEIDYMIGDVNMFFNDYENPHAAELEIMIAEEAFRGKGIGKEAICLMMHYGFTKLNVNKFFVKINKSNIVSIEMFKK